ncbi:hypothetical protein BpHYR1_002325 [Brachionus plicatilis]|uniref:Uncharacterized protein n=1 Tax=Brachionus plicatilis TaxID=10195 RepID=A0A3M7SYF4_BRAPC|nr:hypothetical protein BpHYR1_002325 [Brachionus plicatilis]
MAAINNFQTENHSETLINKRDKFNRDDTRNIYLDSKLICSPIIAFYETGLEPFPNSKPLLKLVLKFKLVYQTYRFHNYKPRSLPELVNVVEMNYEFTPNFDSSDETKK